MERIDNGNERAIGCNPRTSTVLCYSDMRHYNFSISLTMMSFITSHNCHVVELYINHCVIMCERLINTLCGSHHTNRGGCFTTLAALSRLAIDTTDRGMKGLINTHCHEFFQFPPKHFICKLDDPILSQVHRLNSDVSCVIKNKITKN